MGRVVVRRRKALSSEALRARLLAYLVTRGGALISESAHNGVVGYVFGGTVRFPLAKGALLVHLPDDNSGHGYTVNTRFVEGATLPGEANPHSGKWNFSCFDEEDELFRTFTRCLEVYTQQAEVPCAP